MPTIRKATPDDHEKILKVSKTSSYTRDFSNRVMFSSDDAYAKGWIRVLVEGDEIIGFYCVRHAKRWPETILYFITVHPDHRSKGYGEFLINDIMDSSPHKSIRLNVMKDNPRAVAFYERLGFEKKGHSLDGKAYSMVKMFEHEE